MAIAPSQAGIGIRRHFTTEGVHPYDDVDWERRDARITELPRRIGGVRAARCRVPDRLVGTTPPTSSPRSTSAARLGTAERETVAARRSSTACATPITEWGVERRLLRRRAARPRASGAELKPPARHPEGGVQLAGVVQHRRRRRAAAGHCLLHPRRSTTRWTRILNWYAEEGRIFKGGSGAGVNLSRHPGSSKERLNGGGTASGPVSFMRGADAIGRHHQVGRQDPPGRQDGDPRRRSSRHRGVHLVQGPGGAQGPGARGRRLRHEPRRRRHRARCSTRTPTTRCASPTSSCRPSSTTPTGI